MSRQMNIGSQTWDAALDDFFLLSFRNCFGFGIFALFLIFQVGVVGRRKIPQAEDQDIGVALGSQRSP
jgi:hypothetical protein